MITRIIASGGTGQHVVLAYLRLCVLATDILFETPYKIGERILPHIYIFDRDKGGSPIADKPAASQLIANLNTIGKLGFDINFIEPIPIIRDENIDTFGKLFGGSTLTEVLFNSQQRNVKFLMGNFGEVAVGATNFYGKERDIESKDVQEANKDPNYEGLRTDIRKAADQRITHVGSTIGGTGSGVMPAALSIMSDLKEENYHLAIPFLEWFRLDGEGEDKNRAEARNSLMRQNSSSGLSFYLNNLKAAAAVLPLGYPDTMGESFIRPWQDNFNQSAKEDALHLAAALASWNFFYDEKPWPEGIYTYTSNDHGKLPLQSRIEKYSVASLLKANLILIQHADYICKYLRNPLHTKYVLFEPNRLKISVSIFESLTEGEMLQTANALEGMIKAKKDCCYWLKNLPNVDEAFRKIEIQELKAFSKFQELLQGLEASPSIDKDKLPLALSSLIYKHLVPKAKNNLEELKDIRKATRRFLPAFMTPGVGWEPSFVGDKVETEPTQIRRLFIRKEIQPKSIPSPLSITHYLTNFCFKESYEDDPRGKDEEKWSNRYLQILLGMAAGIIELEKVRIQEKSISTKIFNLENVLKELPKYDDESWRGLDYLWILKFKKSRLENIIVGATSPKTYVFPSMSANEEVWKELQERLQSDINGVEARKLLINWCEEIIRWDVTPEYERPSWFLHLLNLFKNELGTKSQSKWFSWSEDLPVLWGGGEQ